MADTPDAAPAAPIHIHGTRRLRQCRRGLMLYDMGNMPIGTLLDRFGEYAESQVDIFRQQLRAGMTVVEVGANLGAQTVAIAQAVGAQGRVLAFEPRRPLFQLLCANLALNAIDNVEAHWVAVGATARPVGVRYGATAAVERVQLVTLDSFELPACHMMRIDESGLEDEVIAGARQTILRHKPVIYVGNEVSDKSAALIQLLWDLDYDCYWHEAPRVRVPNFRGDAYNNYPDQIAVSLLCVPRSRKATITGFRKVESPQEKPAWQGTLSLASTNLAALNERGLALHDLKRFEEGLAFYDRALQLNPGVPEILYNRGNTLAAMQRHDEALASYEQALAAKPDYVAALNNRGFLLEQMKRADEALASYDKALAVSPDDTRSRYNRETLLAKLKAPTEKPAPPPIPTGTARVEERKPQDAAPTAAAKSKPGKKKSPKGRRG